jgi:DNA-binding NtrC family response regulator
MKIIIAEDDPDQGLALAAYVRRAGHEVVLAPSGREALDAVKESVDLLLSDLHLPDMTGIELLRQARARHPLLEVLILTAFGTVDTAVESMRWGARNYLTKPVNPEEFLRHLQTVEELIRLRSSASRAGRGALVGMSTAMQKAYAAIDLAAASAAPVLITGETGTGKELAAQALHRLSPRHDHPFIPVNVGALPEALVEAELFGHEKGAFTGAHRKKEGRFTLAQGGTLFLDELDALPLPLQPKLLRSLEAREVWPVGAEAPVPVDVRLVAATGADPERLKDGRVLRPDLFYRLSVFTIHMPPLRERVEDIPLLVRALLDQESRNIQVREDATHPPPLGISAEALAALLRRPWPGNVRELRNVIEQAVARLRLGGTVAGTIEVEHLGAEATATGQDLPFKEAKARASEEWTRQAVLAAVASAKGNVSEAARRMQMNTSALFRLIKKYGIEVERLEK